MRTLLILLLFSSLHVVLSSCPITISELQLSTKTVRQEFIELKKHCNESVDLSAYTLAFWRGGTGHGEGNSSLSHVIHFSDMGWWTEMNTTYLVIGFNVSTDNVTDAEFISFEEAHWKKNTDFYIDRGNARTNAFVLYVNLTQPLQINTTLSNDTAHHANIVDVLFFYRGKTGSAHHIKDFLFPEYQVGPNPDGYYRIKDDRNDQSPNKGSFAFCCNDSMVQAKWPMGYKWTEPTPGMDNKCSDADHAVYCFDPEYKNFPKSVDRCDVAQVKNFFASTTVRPVTTTRPTGTTTAPAHKPSSLGLSVGIPVAVACVALMAFAFFVIYRRRRYSALPADRTTWNLNCFNRPDDTDRLVLDSS